MQSLLRWGIENSTTGTTGSDASGGGSPLTRRTDLDPGIIDAILGRPDSELMKEALARAQDTSLDEDARLTALDDLEMVTCFSFSSLHTPARHSTQLVVSCLYRPFSFLMSNDLPPRTPLPIIIFLY